MMLIESDFHQIFNHLLFIFNKGQAEWIINHPGSGGNIWTEPWRMVITLRDASARIASRRELLPTFSRSHITVSFGSLSPGCRFSSSMYLIILSAILLGKSFFLWNFACDFASCCPIPWCLVFLYVLNILSNISLAFFLSVTPGKYSLYPIVV